MDPEKYLTDWLLKDRVYLRMQGVPEGYHYAGISDFLLRHGVWYPSVPFPAGIRKGRKRFCFRNAAVLAIEQRQSYRYVEGYALYPELGPVHHAWNVDNDGNLFDRTWKNRGAAYLGVMFSTRRVVTPDGWCQSVFYDPEGILKKPWIGECAPQS